MSATEADLLEAGFTEKQIVALVRERGISPSVVLASGISSESDPKKLAKNIGHLWTDEHLPALLIPYFIPFCRDAVFRRAKPACPMRIKGKVKRAKYLQRTREHVRVYFPPGMRGERYYDFGSPLILTEGEFKALSAESHGFSCLAFSGVNAWHRAGETSLHPDLAHANLSERREVFIAYDADSETNGDVRREKKNLANALLRFESLKVYDLKFPGDAPKLDDFLVAHGRDALLALMEDARKNGEITREKPLEIEEPKLAKHLTDLGNAERLVERHGDRIRYVATQRRWYCWDGTRWALEETGELRRLAVDTVRSIYAEAQAEHDNDRRRAIAEHAKRSESKARIEAMVELAGAIEKVAARKSDFDRDPWLINTLTGTVDLRTGRLRPHDPADMISKIVQIKYDPKAEAPLFERFLAEIQPEKEVRAYLARFAGYAAVGIVREHVLGVWWGPGNNGKSVLAKAIMHALGEFAVPGPRSLIVASKGHESHPTDLATCDGKRLVVVHETEKGGAFDAAKVKLLTGGDTLIARFMRGDFFAFEPTHTALMLSNYRPTGDANDAALWRRVQLVPFDVVVGKDQIDETLPDKLQGEASGILRWVVAGALEWQRIGLAPPAKVRAQTEVYRSSQDVIGRFLAEACEVLPGSSVRAGLLYERYRTWCDESGSQPTSNTTFGRELAARGLAREEQRTGRVYRGLDLRRAGAAEGVEGVDSFPLRPTRTEILLEHSGKASTPSTPSAVAACGRQAWADAVDDEGFDL